MNKVVVAYLLWLTDENFDRRWPIVQQSCRSFYDQFSKQDCEVLIVNNGTIFPDELAGFRVVNLSQNYFDIAVHYAGLFYAQHIDASHFAYFYDDFTYSSHVTMHDAMSFMIEENIVSMRLPSYEHNNNQFNTTYTNKFKNPDSVRHDVGAGNFPLIQTHIRDDFFVTNWRPNSRPMLWEAKHFSDHYAMIRDDHVVMQWFETHMYNIADDLARNNKYNSSFLNHGMCSTFNVSTSERARDRNNFKSVTTSTKMLKDEVEKVGFTLSE